MFRLTDQPIVVEPLDCASAGGFVLFDGKVRNHAGGLDVLKLEYEAYPELALAEGNKLVQEAMDRFGLCAVDIVHRTGSLEIGESAVVIQVAAPHRREAFAGCEWIIDKLKIRVPIWKRETYVDGDSGWVGADAPPAPQGFDEAFFRRQIVLSEIGPEGQKKLASASVLLVGVGGLGSGCLPALVGAGIGRIGLVDPDAVELSNLHRQTIYRAEDTGRSKVERAAAFATRLRPTAVIETHEVGLSAENVDHLVSNYDWVIDGTDSLEVKFILNAACKRHAKHLVTASVHTFEGQLMTVSPDGPCLNCLFPEPPSSGCVGTCGDNGVLGVLPGLFGMLQANEVLKGVLGYGPTLANESLLMDLRSGDTMKLRRSLREGCLGCQGIAVANDLVVTYEEAQARWPDFVLVDIREGADTVLPVEHLCRTDADLKEATPESILVLSCMRGMRSQRVAMELRSRGHAQVFSLKGGASSFGL